MAGILIMQHQFIKNTIPILFLSLFLLCSCNRDTETEKHPDFSKNIIDVSDKIVSIKTNMILGRTGIVSIGKYLLLRDDSSFDKGFHLFDKKTFEHIASTGSIGQGPGQIIKYSNAKILPNTADNKSFYVFDYSQLLLYKYVIDSILNNPQYLPQEVLRMNNDRVIGSVSILNDSIFCGVFSRLLKSRSIVDELAQFNINTGKIKNITSVDAKNKEEARKTHSNFALFPTKDKCIQAYSDIDLLTIYDINGKLLCNIYGSFWGSDKKNFEFYEQIEISKKYIIAKYLGGIWYARDENQRLRCIFSSKLLVFDIKGNYLKTLNIGEELGSFCFDEENNRIILNFLDRDEPLAYLDLKGILD